jgi:hypothetical protein
MAIAKRWKFFPRLRVATGLKDAMNDWPLGSFGDDESKTGDDIECWLCTDSVHASEMVMNCPEIAASLAKAPDDIRELFTALRHLLDERDEAVRLLHLLDRPGASHPDVTAFFDRIQEG